MITWELYLDNDRLVQTVHREDIIKKIQDLSESEPTIKWNGFILMNIGMEMISLLGIPPENTLTLTLKSSPHVVYITKSTIGMFGVN